MDMNLSKLWVIMEVREDRYEAVDGLAESDMT